MGSRTRLSVSGPLVSVTVPGGVRETGCQGAKTAPAAMAASMRATSWRAAEPGDVAGAGFAVGYGSPSQFSRECRRAFGVPPSRDTRVPI
jgi:AraC-like DNA-binding protein